MGTRTQAGRNRDQGLSRHQPWRPSPLALLLAIGLAGCTTAGSRDHRPAPPPGLFGEPGPIEHGAGEESGEQVAELSSGRKLEKAEIFSGAGARLGQPAPVSVSPAEGGLSLNFVDAPLKDVVEAILGETLGVNYVIDPGTDARITARSARPIAKDRLIPVLEDILALNNLALVKRPQGYRILPIEKASLVVLNFTLQFIPPAERLPLLRRIHAGLVEGGALVLSEKIEFANDIEDDFQRDMQLAFKRANGYSDLEIARKRSALERVLTPETLDEHRQRLQWAGFGRVHLWHQCFNFGSLVALK